MAEDGFWAAEALYMSRNGLTSSSHTFAHIGRTVQLQPIYIIMWFERPINVGNYQGLDAHIPAAPTRATFQHMMARTGSGVLIILSHYYAMLVEMHGRRRLVECSAAFIAA